MSGEPLNDILACFHAHDGIFFMRRRQDFARVHIVKTRDRKEPGPGNVEFDLDLSVDEFCSAFCSVSDGGEESYRWFIARAFFQPTTRA